MTTDTFSTVLRLRQNAMRLIDAGEYSLALELIAEAAELARKAEQTSQIERKAA